MIAPPACTLAVVSPCMNVVLFAVAWSVPPLKSNVLVEIVCTMGVCKVPPFNA